MPPPLPVTFVAGASGEWRIDRIEPVRGATLPFAPLLRVIEGACEAPDGAWVLRGSTGNLRYTERGEADLLATRQQGLSRPGASCAALIPIRKNEAWWAMAQDERRAAMEGETSHVGIGLDALPAVARRLHHSRELGEPFDFLTWFEFAPEHQAVFDAMLARLRATREWGYVEREVDIRLSRA